MPDRQEEENRLMKNNFTAFVKKESLHILRDVRTMMIVILIPIVLMVLFGFAISTEVNNIKVAVVAPHRTDMIREAVTRLEQNEYFTFCGYVGEKEADMLLRSGRADAVVVFATDYDRRMMQASEGLPSPTLIQLVLDASDVNTAGAAQAYLQGILLGSASAQDMFETRMLFNPRMKSAFNFVPGIMGFIFILVCAMMTSISIVREKETGTMEVLLVSPVRPQRIIIAKMIPYFVISCIVLVMTLVLARYLLDVPMSGGAAGIVFVSILYILLSLTLGLFVSSVAKTQIAALLISAMVMMIPILMLSGLLFPIENLPEFFRILSNIVPARWYIDAMRKMMIQGVSVISVWQDCLVLLGMTVVLFAVSFKLFKNKLE